VPSRLRGMRGTHDECCGRARAARHSGAPPPPRDLAPMTRREGRASWVPPSLGSRIRPERVVGPSRAMSLSAAITLSSDTRTTTGILLLTLVAVEYGGLFMLRLVRGRQPATPFQRSFARAGPRGRGRYRRHRRLPRPHRYLDGGDPVPGRLLPLLCRSGKNRAEPPDRPPLRGRRLAHRWRRCTWHGAARWVAVSNGGMR
jgi:hypothetical protein